MPRLLIFLMLLPLLSAPLFSASAEAQNPEKVPSGEATVKKGLLTITTPAHQLVFAEAPAWTIRQMSYNGQLLLSQTGAFGSVANSKGTGWEGTGHGYETVEKIELEVDGKFHPLEEELSVSGTTFTLHKQSRFGPYRHTSTIRLSGNTLHEKFDYEVVEDDSRVNYIYAFMHCMTNTTSVWKARLADGSIKEGKFLDDNSFSLKKDALWIAAYSNADQLGVVYTYPQAYKGTADFANAFWNRPRDNKLYFRPEIPRGIGTKFSYEITLHPFNASPEDWEERVAAIVAASQQKAPVK